MDKVLVSTFLAAGAAIDVSASTNQHKTVQADSNVVSFTSKTRVHGIKYILSTFQRTINVANPETNLLNVAKKHPTDIEHYNIPKQG